MAIKYSKGTEILKKQSDVYTLISQIQIKTTVTIQTQWKFLEDVNRWKKIFFMWYLKEVNLMTRAF